MRINVPGGRRGGTRAPSPRTPAGGGGGGGGRDEASYLCGAVTSPARTKSRKYKRRPSQESTCRSRPSARYACPPPAQSDTRASGWLTGPVSSLPYHSQAILAFSTGAAASGAGTFVIVHSIWQHAQLQGEAADARVTELRRLHGTHLETARPREVRASACSPSRIAPCQCSSLACVASALSRSRWPFPAYSTSGYDAI